MVARIARTVCTVALGYTLLLLPFLAADGRPPPAKAPDWSGYSPVGDVVGEVVKADDGKVTVRVTWFVQQGKAAVGIRPRLSKNPKNFRNPLTPAMAWAPPGLKEEHHDYELEFVAESLVRTKSLPPKYNDKGKRVDHTREEISALRSPEGAPWYAASTADLVPGTIVEVTLVRDKSVPAAKVTEEDLRVKYVVILGKDPNPPKEDGKKSEGKKK